MQFLNRLYESPRCQAAICGTGAAGEHIACPEGGSAPCIAISDIKENLKSKGRPYGATGKGELEITIKDELLRDTREQRQVKMIVD